MIFVSKKILRGQEKERLGGKKICLFFPTQPILTIPNGSGSFPLELFDFKISKRNRATVIL